MWPSNIFKVFICEDVIILIENSPISYLQFYNDVSWRTESNEVRKQLKSPQSAEFLISQSAGREQDEPLVLKNAAFDIKDWLEHLSIIFGNSQINKLCFQNHSMQYDFDSIKKTFRNFTVSELFVGSFSLDFNLRVFKEFLPIEKVKSTDDDQKIPLQVLMQSLYCIDPSLPISLDDLLMTNSKFINTTLAGNLLKHLNQFIKLWQQGACPHLELLHVNVGEMLRDGSRMNIIMKGITSQDSPKGRKIKFRSGTDRETIKGGIDIYRYDGTKATITVRYINRSLKMFVLFDHCIVG
ncbi:hypothetical protein CAEBREN_21451 [Caenorhabditis brenneri]|uniref:Sdz-33 F-box domain-containing protein n=1 Tax=Caenorhabditis brenneri TaxID=135651 RepID=G0NZL1_CAEBE|nr:hypothetical protein CAEBREN_21451 [Caenorhabditis brenneri]